VGPCPSCGQPLCARPGDPHPAVPWTLDGPEGPVTVCGAQVTGPSGPLVASEVDALLEAHHRERWDLRPSAWLFPSFVLVMMLAPLLLWMSAASSVVVFLTHFGQGP
jgi:hypothetical protein